MPVGKSLESSLQWLLEAECLLVRGRIGGNERASGHVEREERAFDPPGPRVQGASSQRVARGARQRGYKGLGHAGTLRGPQAEVRLDRQSPPAFTGAGSRGSQFAPVLRHVHSERPYGLPFLYERVLVV